MKQNVHCAQEIEGRISVRLSGLWKCDYLMVCVFERDRSLWINCSYSFQCVQTYKKEYGKQVEGSVKIHTLTGAPYMVINKVIHFH